MKNVKNQRTTNLLIRLKKVSEVYKIATNEQRIRLFDKCDFLIKDLVEVGFDRVFIEALIVSGNDFLKTVFNEDNKDANHFDCQVMFK